MEFRDQTEAHVTFYATLLHSSAGIVVAEGEEPAQKYLDQVEYLRAWGLWFRGAQEFQDNSMQQPPHGTFYLVSLLVGALTSTMTNSPLKTGSLKRLKVAFLKPSATSNPLCSAELLTSRPLREKEGTAGESTESAVKSSDNVSITSTRATSTTCLKQVLQQ